jgi:hypothetical protein
VYGALNQLYGTGSDLVQMISVYLLKKLPVVVEHLGSFVFTQVYHHILSCDVVVEFKSAHPISLKYVLIILSLIHLDLQVPYMCHIFVIQFFPALIVYQL